MSFDLDDETVDDDIINIYRDSSYDHIDKIVSFLFELEFDKNDLKNILVEINRSAHSLKGDSNSLGFREIGAVAHKMESYIHALQNEVETFTDDSLSIFFNYMEQIKALLDTKFSKTQTENQVNDDKESIEKLYIFLNNCIEVLNKFNKENQNYDDINELFENNIQILQNNYKNDDISGILEKIIFHFSEIKEKNSEKDIFPLSSYLTDLSFHLEKKLDYQEKYQNNKEETKIDTFIEDINEKDDDRTIRVSLQKIDLLIDYSSELIANFVKYDHKLEELKEIYSFVNQIEYEKSYSNLAKLSKMLFTMTTDLKKDNLNFYSLVNNLNYDIKKTRMLPAKGLLEQMRVVARTAGMKLGKLVKFNITGQDTELDLFLLEKIKDPLSHIIRNSIDHGIETKEERDLSNKQQEATLELKVFLSGSDVVFEVKDDGKGINYEKIKSKAVSLNLVDAQKAEKLTKEELNVIMFMAGFSTSEKVTDISGRGVGLDVVKSTIESLGGLIKIDSEENIGTTFTMKVSLKLTNFESLILKLANKQFAIPSSYVSSIVAMNINDIIYENNQQFVLINENKLKIVDLSEVLNLKRENDLLPEDFFVLLLSVRENTVAFIIDELIEIKEIVMKDMGRQIRKMKNISGVTILGNGTPILVLNPYDIVASFETSFINSNILEKMRTEAVLKENIVKRKALVVDDSITTRTLEKNILESSGFDVRIAKDGLEGTEVLRSFSPDIVITDCEMPKMNGYEFTKWIRESGYKDLPVIMVTSLADNEFKMKGMEAGVDSYIVKGEFNQETFLDTISTLLV